MSPWFKLPDSVRNWAVMLIMYSYSTVIIGGFNRMGVGRVLYSYETFTPPDGHQLMTRGRFAPPEPPPPVAQESAKWPLARTQGRIRVPSLEKAAREGRWRGGPPGGGA